VHRGPEIRDYLTTPYLRLRLVALPAYSPDFNPDEAIWDWAREEVTANTCFGTTAKVQEKMGLFFANLVERPEEVQRRCRTILQSQADTLIATSNQLFGQPNHVEFTLVSV
jgi:transposase